MRTSISLLGIMLMAGCASPTQSTPTVPFTTSTPTELPAPSIADSATPPPEVITTRLEASKPIVCPDANANNYEIQGILPDTSTLHWQQVAGQPSLYTLAGLTTSLVDITAEASPDGRWWTVHLKDGPAGEAGGNAALYVLDTEKNQHWIASTRQGIGGPYRVNDHDWLPDGRLAWVNHYDLFVATAGGENLRDLNAPEQIREVWAISNDLLLAIGDRSLWRVDLTSSLWDRAINNSNPAYIGRALFSISPDGSYAAVTVDNTLWKVPLEVGKPPKHIADVKMVYDRWPAPPQVIGDSPYWFPGGRVSYNDDGSSPVASLVDTRDGSAIPIDDLITPYRHVVARDSIYSLSPDGKWFRTSVTAPDHPDEKKVYIAPVSDLDAGWLLPGDDAGWWGKDNSSFGKRENTADGYRYIFSSFPDGRILRIWAFHLPEPDAEFGLYLSDHIVKYKRRIYVLSEVGSPLSHVDLPVPARPYYYSIYGVSHGKLLAGGLAAGPDCAPVPGIWLWRLNE